MLPTVGTSALLDPLEGFSIAKMVLDDVGSASLVSGPLGHLNVLGYDSFPIDLDPEGVTFRCSEADYPNLLPARPYSHGGGRIAVEGAEDSIDFAAISIGNLAVRSCTVVVALHDCEHELVQRLGQVTAVCREVHKAYVVFCCHRPELVIRVTGESIANQHDGGIRVPKSPAVLFHPGPEDFPVPVIHHTSVREPTWSKV